MGVLSRSNLKEFCRTCLKSLQPKINSTSVIGTDSQLSYNIFMMPNLAKLMILFTSLNVSDESDDMYPNSLCQPCYYKLLDFQDFRQLALQSAEELHRVLNSVSSVTESKGCGTERAMVEVEMGSKTRDNDSDMYRHLECLVEDAELLLPEATTHLEKPIKAEPIEIDDSRVQTTTQQILAEYEKVDVIKNEIDSEYEEEDTTFYERNALAPDSIGDDADDEEHSLRNGAANTSSFSATSQTAARQRSKRDRSKKSLKCPRCDKQVYKQVYLDAHIRAVHEGHEKPFLCLECQKAFTRYNQLHVHIQANHLLQQKFDCEFDGCDASFKMNNTLETHRKVVHTFDAAPFALDLIDVIEKHQEQLTREIEMDHICQQCCKKYSSKRALSEHLKRHAQIKEHVCTVCGAAKVTRTELRTHMRTHEPNLKKFQCSICPQEFNHKNAISRHVRVVHEGQRRFSCSFCSKRFGTSNAQKCHERLHVGERPFNCGQCRKRFAQLNDLKSHMTSSHHDKSLRKHVCSYCSRRFITKKNVVDHEERHRGDKPHLCDMCNRGFFNQKDLKTHRKNFHLEKNVDRQPNGEEDNTDQTSGSHSNANAGEQSGDDITGSDGSSQSSK